jgi:integrase
MSLEEVYDEDKKTMMWKADYSVTVNGKRKRIRKNYFSKKEAEKAIRRDMVAAEKGEYYIQANVTLKEWEEKVIKYVKAQRNGSTVKSYAHVLPEFVSIIGERRKVDSLDRNDFNKYVQHLKNEGMSDATIKTYFNRVRAGLNFAPQLFDSLLHWQVPSYRLEAHTPSRDRVLEVDELERLKSALAASHQDHLDVVLCALNTGGRLREILSLSWDRVLWNVGKFKHGVLKLKVTKTRGKPVTYRIVPMTDELASILHRRQSVTVSPFVFPSDRGKKKHRNHMEAPLKEACKVAKIIYGRDVEGGFVFHDLRRTSVTYLRREGVEIEEVIAITGHSELVMLKTYSKTNEENLQKAIDKLGNALKAGQLKELEKKENTEKLPVNDEATAIA